MLFTDVRLFPRVEVTFILATHRILLKNGFLAISTLLVIEAGHLPLALEKFKGQESFAVEWEIISKATGNKSRNSFCSVCLEELYLILFSRRRLLNAKIKMGFSCVPASK